MSRADSGLSPALPPNGQQQDLSAMEVSVSRTSGRRPSAEELQKVAEMVLGLVELAKEDLNPVPIPTSADSVSRAMGIYQLIQILDALRSNPAIYPANGRLPYIPLMAGSHFGELFPPLRG